MEMEIRRSEELAKVSTSGQNKNNTRRRMGLGLELWKWGFCCRCPKRYHNKLGNEIFTK